MVQKKLIALRSCFETLSNILGLQIVELRIRSGENVSLVQRFMSDEAKTLLGDTVDSYQNSLVDNASPRSICQHALQSENGFYWISEPNESFHRRLPICTAIGFHLPRDHIEIDAFIVAYSSKYAKVST